MCTVFTLCSEKRTLESALQFYCDKTLENAHSAEADTQRYLRSFLWRNWTAMHLS